MGTYASETKVSPERSRAELEQILARYGADAFGYGYEGHRATIQFRADGRHVRFDIAIPEVADFRYTRPGGRDYAVGARQRTNTQMQAAQEQAVRQRWRALVLVVKAKLEAVESGIVTFEQEFLAHIMLPDGSTTYDWMAPQLQEVYEHGNMPGLLPPARAELGAG